MNYRKKSSRGSAHAIVTIVLVVALVGVLGFMFWQNFTQKESDTAKKETPSTIQPSEKAESSEDSKYLALKDWGVKFEIPDSLKSTAIEYVDVTDEANPDKNTTYGFTTKRYKELDGACQMKTDQMKALTIISKDKTGPDQPHIDTVFLNDSKPINGYYYTTTGSSSQCSSNQETLKTEKADREALNEMIRTVMPL